MNPSDPNNQDDNPNNRRRPRKSKRGKQSSPHRKPPETPEEKTRRDFINLVSGLGLAHFSVVFSVQERERRRV